MSSQNSTYEVSLRIVSALCLALALVFAFRVATIHVAQGSSFLYLYEVDYRMALILMIQRGILGYIATATLSFCASLRQTKVIYWGIQAVIWLIGITLWYQTPLPLTPWPQDPLWIGITLFCSLALFACYKPVTSILASILNIPHSTKGQVTQVKNEPYQEMPPQEIPPR